MVESRSISSRIRVVAIYGIIIFLAVLCFVPLANVVAISFSDATSVAANRVWLWPVHFNTKAYAKILEDKQFWRSFGISTIRVILALAINLSLLVMTAYPLSKTKDQFRCRNICMMYFVFAMLFSGGTIPTYLVVNKLGLVNKIWALILPGALPIGNMIMMMNFFAGIPKSLEEAAVIDGATPWQVLWHVFLPCSKPSLATMALFSIVGHWNDFYDGLLYMTKVKNYPMMSYIQSLQVDMASALESGMDAESLAQLMQVSGGNLNAAKVVVATVPLLLIYPFLQKYLITGIVMGAVKE